MPVSALPSIALNNAATRRATAPAALAAPVAVPAPVRTQVPAARPGQFSDLEAFKAYVKTSELTQLPAARSAVEAAKGQLGQANKSLDARKKELNHDGLKAALASAEQGLLKAQFPMREAGAAKKAEANRLSSEIASVSSEINTIQQQIGRAQSSQAARNRDIWFGDNSHNDDLLDAVLDVAGAVGDASAVRNGNQRISALISRKVTLEQKALALTMEGTALEHVPGDLGSIAAARKVRDDAAGAFNGAVAGQSDAIKGVEAAQRTLNGAQGNLDRLEALKTDLMDYSKQFTFGSRAKLNMSDWGWKKELDAFFTQQGF